MRAATVAYRAGGSVANGLTLSNHWTCDGRFFPGLGVEPRRRFRRLCGMSSSGGSMLDRENGSR
eukprot:6819809-Prorocentrum_lima.AAC.1